MDLIYDFLEKSSDFFTGNTKISLASCLICVAIAYNLKKWLTLRFFYKGTNIPHLTPLPIFGNMLGIVKKGLIEHDSDLIKTHGKIVGYFEGSDPVVLTTDINLTKLILNKDFNNFRNRKVFDALMIYPYDKFLTNLQDDEWKNARAIVTTTFTSGKLKLMSGNIKDITKKFTSNLDNMIQNQNGILNTKSLFSAYSLDVISSCCFGVDTNSIDDPNNDLLKHIKKLFEISFSKNPKLLFIFFFPKFSRFLAEYGILNVFPKETFQIVSSLVNEIIRRRKRKSERREDFIQHMIECEDENNDLSSKSNKKTLTNKEILSQSLLFMFGGYDTTSSTLCFMAYNLARFPDYQDQLLAEIDQVLDKHDGELNYECVNDMKFMDMIIYETLRMYPAAVRLDRVTNNDYKYENMVIKKGITVAVSIWGLHYDPGLFPDPFTFKPERFNQENQKLRENISFLAFGSGPRNCLGMRFAILEIKLLMSEILRNYKFESCDQTPENVLLDKASFGSKPKSDIIVRVVNRS